MRIRRNEITFIELINNGVLAIYKDCRVSVSKYRSYQLNCQEAHRQLNEKLNPDMKTLNKDNFMAAVEAHANTLGKHTIEYSWAHSKLAKNFLEDFYNDYFEIDQAKEARRAEYLKLKEEFGDE